VLILLLLLLLLVSCIGLVASSRALWLVVLLLLLLPRLLPCLSMVWLLLLLLLLLAVALLGMLHVWCSLSPVLLEAATTAVSSSSKVRGWCCKVSSMICAHTWPIDGPTTVHYCMSMRRHRHLLGLAVLPLTLLLLWRLLLPPAHAGCSLVTANSSSGSSSSSRNCVCWCDVLRFFHDHCSTAKPSDGTQQSKEHAMST
jgi:hypothetical protein